jgi:hypothetical protein
MATKHGGVIVAMAVLMVGSVLWAHSSRAEPAAISDSVLQRFSDGSIVEGSSSMLVRTDKGVTMTIHTSGLQPGAAHSVWWVIFNHPEHCAVAYACVPNPTDLSTTSDLYNLDVKATMLNATGHVVGNNGVGNFAAYLAEGDTSGLSLPIAFPGDAHGLIDARKAMFFIVVRTHGQPIPGRVKEQFSMFNAVRCDDLEGNPPAEDPTDACDNEQFTVFVP